MEEVIVESSPSRVVGLLLRFGFGLSGCLVSRRMSLVTSSCFFVNLLHVVLGAFSFCFYVELKGVVVGIPSFSCFFAELVRFVGDT
jgi:hypothetical protein